MFIFRIVSILIIIRWKKSIFIANIRRRIDPMFRGNWKLVEILYNFMVGRLLIVSLTTDRKIKLLNNPTIGM